MPMPSTCIGLGLERLDRHSRSKGQEGLGLGLTAGQKRKHALVDAHVAFQVTATVNSKRPSPGRAASALLSVVGKPWNKVAIGSMRLRKEKSLKKELDTMKSRVDARLTVLSGPSKAYNSVWCR